VASCSSPWGRHRWSHPPQDHPSLLRNPERDRELMGQTPAQPHGGSSAPVPVPRGLDRAVEQSVAARSMHSLSCCGAELLESSSPGGKGGCWAEGMPVPPRVCAGVSGSSGPCFKASLRLPAAREKLSPTPPRSTDLSA